MATIQITTTERQDRAAQIATNRYNASGAGQTVSVLQFVRMRIAHLLDGWAEQFDAEERVSKAELYRRASDADKATVDAVLGKYV